ncbi:CARDB domain-containing protein [Roseimaritima ulvae]|nr:CARDB domain-containing protein [Roseimaritima ulvae]
MGAESSNLDEDLFALGFMRADSLISLSLDLPEWSTLSPTLEILDSSGAVVAEASESSPLSVSFSALVDGNYFARVRTELVILNGSRFTLTDQSDDWGVVRAEAQAAGGDLVSIGSFEENEWIHDTFGGNHWIGFTDQASEGTYQWIDGSPVTYTGWAGNEPNTPSYDHAYLSTNAHWYDHSSTANYSGIIETSSEVGDPLVAHAGAEAQYVLSASVELRDFVPPVVTVVNRLPTEDGTLEQVLSTFNVTLSELDPETLSDGAFDLRAAGNDGVFDTADDHVYGLSYSHNDLTLYFTVTDGPLVDGPHRFTIVDSLTDLPVAEAVPGNALDGNADGTAGGDFIRSFTIDAVPDGVVFEGSDNGSFDKATHLELTADANETGWLRSEVGYGSIDPAPYNSYGEYDWWSFEGQAGDHVDVWSQQLESLRPYAQLYRLNDAGDGVQLLTRDGNGGWSGPGNDAYISGYELPVTTTYYVLMGKYRYDQTPGGYDVQIHVARGLDLETDANYVNDSTNGADGLTFEQSGALRTASVAGTVMAGENSNTDQDLFTLGYMRADSLISLSLDLPDWSTLSPTLEILDSSGAVVAEASDSGPLSMSFTALADGNYFARVRTEVAILDGSRYTLTDQADDWGVVRAEAEAAGGDLVSIGSFEENEWIHATFGGSHWIGFTDQAIEGTYQWIDGSPVTYTRWGNNEPNTPSYDHAFLSSNSYWYDYPLTGSLRGIIETSSEAGDPVSAGASLEAQYVLSASVELRDLVPPVVTAVNRLPAEGGTLEQVLSTFNVTFSELDPATLSADAFDLRTAGADGVFDTADDSVYGLSYSRSDLTLHFTVTDGPLVDGEHRFTISDSLTDLPVAEGVAGNALDGDANGTAGGDFIRSFTIDAVPDGVVFEGADNDSFDKATPLELTADANGTDWLRSEVGYGSIDPAIYGSNGEYDWWSFEGQAGDRVDVWSQALEELRPYAQLYRLNDAGDGVQSLTGNGNGGWSGPDNDAYISGYELPATTTYYVRMGKYYWDQTPGGYDLRVNLARGVELETDQNYANDTTGGADGLTFEQSGALRTAKVAGTVMGAESSNLDEDLFALGFMRADSLISLSLDLPEWSALAPTLEILDASGEVVAEANGADPLSASFTALVDGNYFARVRTEFAVLDGSRYTLTDQSAGWDAVRAEAQAAGGDLVSIDSLAENELIHGTLGGSHWIGFTDQASEGTYQWSDGSPVTFTRWASNEPNTPSYDHAYLSSNGYWYDIYSTYSFRGVIETATEVGDPELAGAGVQSQYVLNASVELRDLVPPVVTTVNRLPAEGGTLEQVLSTFNVTFSELDPATLSADAFDLRTAGADGVFDTADDSVYGLSYSRSDLTLHFTVTDGPLVDGEHRFTISDSLTDLPVAEGVAGNALDGDANGTAGGDFIRSFTIDAVPDGVVFEGADNDSFDKATPLELTADANGTDWLRSEVGYGSIDPAIYGSNGEYDWWSFEGQAGDRVDVWSQALEELRPYAQLYRLNDAGDGVQSLTGNGNGGWSGPDNDAYISGYELPATTTYYVRMGKYYWDQTPGGYDLRVNLARGVELETDQNYANDTTGGADGLTFEQSGALRTAKVAGTVMGAESSNLDEDLFALGFMRADSLISLSLDLPEWSALAPTLEILDASGEVVAEANGADPLSASFTALVDGNYFARVRTEFAVLDGSRYTLTDQSAGWDAVRAEAQAAGGDLVSIDSLAENELIHGTLGGSHWIGFTDQASEGTYQWSDGSPVTFTRWASNEPNTPSYDHAYLSSNGYWYDIYSTYSFRGVIETATEVGDPELAGAGVQSQYVLNASVELRDLVPPVVTTVNRLPAEGGTLEQVLSTFNVTFSELDPATLSADAFDLRTAGADGVFDTADDSVYGLSYSRSDLTLHFTVTDGPLVDGEHRFTISDSLTDLPVAEGVAGNALDGDADGAAGRDFVRSFTVDAVPENAVFEGSDNNSYAKATPLAFTADANGTGWLRSEVGYGSIDPAPYQSYGEYDWWSFEGLAGDRVDVWSQQLETLRPYAALYRLNDSGDGVQLLISNGVSGGAGPGDDAYISGYELPATTTYYVRIGKQYYDSTPGGYDVRINVARGLDLETDAGYANDNTSGADVVTRMVDGDTISIAVAGTVMRGENSNVDEDYFNIGNVGADQTILARARLPEYSTLVPVLEIRNANDEVISLSPNPVDANVVRADISEGGIYYIDVVGFDGEGPDAAYVIDVSIQPTSSLDFADLSVSELTVSDDTLQSGQQVEILWTVGNFGAVDTQGDQWVDRVFLSLNDRVGDADDVHLADVPRNGVLAVNDTYTQNTLVQLPIGVSGDYQVLVKTDATDQIAEFLFEDNNVRSLAASDITLTPYADLHATEVVAPELAIVGEPATVNWNVSNAGTGTTGDGTPDGVIESWVDRVYVSTDSTFGNADDRLIAEVIRDGSLAAGESYSGSWTGEVPSGLEGSYHWFVRVDSDAIVYEYDDIKSNVARTHDVVSIAPGRYVDLLPDELHSVTSASSGQLLHVTWTTANQGIRDASGPWTDRLYLSTDSTLSADDTLLNSTTIQHAIDVGDSEAFAVDVTLPERIDGDHYLILLVNATGDEYEFTFGDNNTIASEIVTITRRAEPDLIPAINNAPATIQLSVPFDYSFTIANTGDGNTVDTWIDRVYLSSDVTFDSSDILLSEFVSPAASLPLTQTGTGYMINGSTTLPFGTDIGQYHLLVVTDSLASELETDEANNIVASPAIQVEYPLLPDLVVSDITTAAEVIAGQSIEVSWTVENRGDGVASGPWSDRVLYSLDNAIGNDISLGQFDFVGTLMPGASITRTQTIAFPAGVSGPVRLVVGTDRDNSVFELAGQNNNEAIDDQTLSVIAPAAPNLVVDSIVAPATAFSNQEVTIEWVIQNVGTGATNALSWSDVVYLSLDDTLDGNDRFLGSVRNGSYLNSGESYQSTLTARLPQGIENNYRFIVVADGFNSLVEPEAEDDNTRASTITTVNLTPPPDLVVDAVSATSLVFSGTPFQIGWTVRNQGIGSTRGVAWTDQVFLSFNGDTIDAEDMLVASVPRFDELAPDGTYTVSGISIATPFAASGTAHVIVRTNALGQVYEHVLDFNNDGSRSIEVLQSPTPDLVVTELNAPANAYAGQPFTVQYVVTNEGANATPVASWSDAVYISTDDQLDPDTDMLLGNRLRSGVLDLGESETQTHTFTLPNTLTGEFYVFVVSDTFNTVFESDDDNNTRVSAEHIAVAVSPPDLRVTAASSNSQPRSGREFVVDYTVLNSGPVPTPSNVWFDAYFLSNDATLDPSDVSLGSRRRTGVLASGQQESLSVATILPAGEFGSRFLLIVSDATNQVFELDDENNLFALPLTITDDRPDPQLTSFNPRVTGGQVLPGGTITFDYSVANNGVGPTYSSIWRDSLVLSSDDILGNSDDIQLGSFDGPASLAPSASYSRASLNVAVPFGTPAGTYRLFLSTDSGDAMTESDESNNTLSFAPLVVGVASPTDAADLVVDSVVAPATALSGETLSVSWQVSNAGTRRTPVSLWTDRVWLSTDTTVGPDDLMIGSIRRTERLDAGASYSRTLNYELDVDLEGDFYVVVQTDFGNAVAEGAFEGNNENRSAAPIAISLNPTPDLVVTSITAPSTASSGRTFDLSWTVQNTGPGTAEGNWFDSVYLSLDPIFDRATDISIGYVDRSTPVAPSGSYTSSGTVSVPAALGGRFFVIVVADSTDRLYERNGESNNARVADASIEILHIPPADLVVGEITIPASGMPGQDATITFTVNNTGLNPATGSWSDAIYLSSDETWDINDAFFGRVTHNGNVLAGESYTSTNTAPLPGVLPGDYHVIVRSDILNNLPESDETNNLSGSLDSFAVDVAELTLGTPVAGQIADDRSVYYRVDVELGDTLVIELDQPSADSSVELYVRFDDLPSRSLSDFSDVEPYSTDQRVIVPITRAGTYYILGYGADIEAALPFNLVARTVEFSVLDTDFGSLGATSSNQTTQFVEGEDLSGLNTIRINGAKFTGRTTAELVLGDLVIPAVNYWMTDTSTLYATFDLQGMPGNEIPLGEYDLRVSDPIGGTVTVAESVEVIANTRNSGRITARFEGADSVQINLTHPVDLLIGNTSTADTYAPLITLSSERLGTPFGFSPTNLAVQTVQFLAINDEGPAGIYSPGDTATIPVFFRPNAAQIALDMGIISAQDRTPIDWAAQRDVLKPENLSEQAWDAVFANLTSDIPTWGDFVVMLNENATHLSQLGERANDIATLWDFEVQQAMNSLGPVHTLASMTDITVTAPGLTLDLSRNFGSSIIARDHDGIFGSGWRTIWESTLQESSGGRVTILNGSGGDRHFFPVDDQPGIYSPAYSTSDLLTLVDGEWVLQSTSGLRTGYSANGQLAYIEDANSNRISASYSNGKLSLLEHSSGQHLAIAYDAFGHIRSISDHLARSATYTYDSTNTYLVRVVAPDNTVTEYAYDTSSNAMHRGALTSQVTGGVLLNYGYDFRGRIASIGTLETAPGVSFSYDRAGAIQVNDQLGTATLLYNSSGLLSRITDSIGYSTSISYNADRLVSLITDALGQTQGFEWDEFGNLVSATDQLGNSTAYSYEWMGGVNSMRRLAAYTDANGNSTRYGYDTLGNRNSVTYADGSTEFLPQYDSSGNILEYVNRRGHVTQQSFTDSGQLAGIVFDDGSTVEMTYDALGRLTRVTESGGETTIFEYDTSDRLTRVTDPSGRFLEFEYDSFGRRVSMVDQEGYRVTYSYDNVGRLSEVLGNGSLIARYSYGISGQIERIQRGNGTFSELALNDAGYVGSLAHYSPDQSVRSSHAYTYDVLGRPISDSTDGGTWEYSYDAIGQLVAAEFIAAMGSGLEDQYFEYSYDAVGNRLRSVEGATTVSYVVNTLNQYEQIGDASLEYDADGNLVRLMAGGLASTFAYDTQNQLISASRPGQEWRYDYDAFGTLASIDLNGSRTSFLVDPEGIRSIASEYDSGGSLVARYIYGATLTGRAEGANGDLSYYETDLLGNVTALTSSLGTVLNAYSYSPFGQSIDVLETIGNRFRFSGGLGVTDNGDGFLNMRDRNYSSMQGRFTSVDPIGLAGGSTNLYQYALNSPSIYVDPAGQNPLLLIGIGIGAGIFGSYISTGSVTLEGIVFGLFSPKRFPSAGGAVAVAVENPSEFARGTHVAKDYVRRGLDPAYACERYQNLLEGCNDPPGTPAPPSEQPPGGETPVTPPGQQEPPHSPTVTFPRSFDPNDILGPEGVGDERWVSVVDTLNYTVRFENDPEAANAPAQVVRITQTLDSDVDARTFRLGDFGFGDLVFLMPENRSFYATRLDLRERYGIFVDVAAGVDVSAGEVFWQLTSIDPLTGEVPLDRFIGFLPPNVTAPEGDGFVSYTVRPRASSPNGARIDAEARIFFDENAPIDTPPIFNTIDAMAPDSSVASITSPVGDQRIPVSWAGDDGDIGSGHSTYDVYVRANDGGYALWLADTELTSAEFLGEPSTQYSFYSIARDLVGNVEEAPHVADATITTPDPPDEIPPRAIAENVQAGASQRSYVDTLSFTFDEATNLGDLIANGAITSAVTITNLGINADADPDTPVSTTANQFRYEFDEETGSSRLTWSLDEFNSGRQSLADGVYVFTIDASVVSDVTGNLLDGNGDGIGGDDFLLIFHRLNGDADGSGVVDGADMSVVLQSMGRHASMPNFDPNADLDRDGRITVRDRILVARAMGRSVTPPPEPAALSTLHAGANSFADQDEEEDDLLNLLADDQAQLAGSL